MSFDIDIFPSLNSVLPTSIYHELQILRVILNIIWRKGGRKAKCNIPPMKTGYPPQKVVHIRLATGQRKPANCVIAFKL